LRELKRRLSILSEVLVANVRDGTPDVSVLVAESVLSAELVHHARPKRLVVRPPLRVPSSAEVMSLRSHVASVVSVQSAQKGVRETAGPVRIDVPDATRIVLKGGALEAAIGLNGDVESGLIVDLDDVTVARARVDNVSTTEEIASKAVRGGLGMLSDLRVRVEMLGLTQVVQSVPTALLVERENALMGAQSVAMSGSTVAEQLALSVMRVLGGVSLGIDLRGLRGQI
jgi:hypothetical protein